MDIFFANLKKDFYDAFKIQYSKPDFMKLLAEKIFI